MVRLLYHIIIHLPWLLLMLRRPVLCQTSNRMSTEPNFQVLATILTIWLDGFHWCLRHRNKQLATVKLQLQVPHRSRGNCEFYKSQPRHSTEYRCDIIVSNVAKLVRILRPIGDVHFLNKKRLFLPLTSAFLMN